MIVARMVLNWEHACGALHARISKRRAASVAAIAFPPQKVAPTRPRTTAPGTC